jgi:hypothetical protein
MARMVEVQVRRWQGSGASRAFDWQTITVEEGLRLRDETFRCPVCLGKAVLKRASVDPPMAAHGEHDRRNKGCPLGDCYDQMGIRLHPFALK